MRVLGLIVAIACAPEVRVPDPCGDEAGGEALTSRCRCDAQCPTDENAQASFCDLRTGLCVIEVRECSGQFECCPGQRCHRGVFCLDDPAPCLTGGACAVPGQVCAETGGSERTSATGCQFEPCTAAGECGDGLTCFDGHCVASAPCGGGCGTNGVCVTRTGRCFDVGNGSEEANRWLGSCRVTCGEGAMLVFASPMNVFNRCDNTVVGCACVATPVER